MLSKSPYETLIGLIPFQWIIVDSRVYDVSKFANSHPGGAAVLLVDSIGNFLVLPQFAAVRSCERKNSW
jgi:hypothetical protein